MACTEVRAALFHTRCNPRQRKTLQRFRMTETAQAKLDANEFCVRELATDHLREKELCAAKAERYVDFVFEKCKKDYAPFSSGGAIKKTKSLSEIL